MVIVKWYGLVVTKPRGPANSQSPELAGRLARWPAVPPLRVASRAGGRAGGGSFTDPERESPEDFSVYPSGVLRREK